jgi:hypothetical protein
VTQYIDTVFSMVAEMATCHWVMFVLLLTVFHLLMTTVIYVLTKRDTTKR